MSLPLGFLTKTKAFAILCFQLCEESDFFRTNSSYAVWYSNLNRQFILLFTIESAILTRVVYGSRLIWIIFLMLNVACEQIDAATPDHAAGTKVHRLAAVENTWDRKSALVLLALVATGLRNNCERRKVRGKLRKCSFVRRRKQQLA